MQEYEMFSKLFNDNPNDTEVDKIVDEMKKYDIYDIIAKLSSLNLFSENQNKSILIDYVIAKIIEQKKEFFNSKFIISDGKFKSLLQQISSLSINYAIDPNENIFAQKVMIDKNYIVFNGIDHCPSFNLQNMIDILFLYVNDYPVEFIRKVRILFNLLLGISDEIARNINFNPNNIKYDESHKIIIPDATIIKRYSQYVKIDYNRVYNFLDCEDLLNEMIVSFDTPDTGDMSNRAFYMKLFILDEDNKKLILLNPSLIASFLFYKTLFIAEEFGIKDKLLSRYNDYVFRFVVETLDEMGHKKLNANQFNIVLENNKYYKESILSVYNNQIMICVFICDDGENFQINNLHSNYPDKKHIIMFKERMKYFTSKFKEKKISFDNIYILIIINSIGRGLQLYTNTIPSNHNILQLLPFELKCISINERSRKNFIPKYMKSKDRIKVAPTLFSELNAIEVYTGNNYSFYINDDVDIEYTDFYFGMGDSIYYIDKAIKKEDLQLVKSYKKDWVTKIELVDAIRSTYTEADNKYKNIMSLCIKYDFGLIWFVAGNFETYKEASVYKSLLDCIVYWLGELKTELNKYKYEKDLFVFNIKIVGEIEKCFYDFEEDVCISDLIKYEHLDNEISVNINPKLYSKFSCEANLFEKSFICNLLEQLFIYTKDASTINKISLDVFENPLKKKFYAVKSTDAPYLKPMERLYKIAVNEEDIDALLDFVGKKILNTKKWTVGKILDTDKNKLMNEVVSILYNELQKEIKKLSSNNLIEIIYHDLEEIMYRTMYGQNRYASEIMLYPEKEEEFIKEYDKLNRTSMALKFLIEYVAARPPKGDKILGIDNYERILAICSSIIDWAYKNDLFFYEIFNTPVEILKSKRIGMKQQEFNNMYNYSDKYRREKLYYNSSAMLRKKYRINREDFSKELEDAFNSCYGYTFSNFINIVLDLIEYGEQFPKKEIFVESKDKIIEYLAKKEDDTTLEKINKVLDDITLSKRDDFLKLPPPYKNYDVYPWRFNRAYSFNRRPIIARDDSIIWGNRQLYHMIKYLQEVIFEGKLYTEDEEMRKLLGKISDDRGKKFNKMVAEMLSDLKEFDVKPNVTKINQKHITDEKNNTLGDIDILLIDKKKHTIYVSEVKDFNFSRNPYEIHMEYEKMFVDGKSLCYVSKHMKRLDWVRGHFDDLRKEYNLDNSKWQIKGLFIIHDQLISSKIYKKPIKVLSINELTVKKIRNL
mgnify:CR=1 FL=1